MTIIKYGDLCCGLGAFHTTFNRCSNDNIKYECVFACDIDKNIRNIYQENYHIRPEGDIYELDLDSIPEMDILCAGFPCTTFSIAGKKQAFSDEKRGGIFFRILEIIDAKEPSIVFLENVKNLHTINNGEVFQTIIDELEDRNYHISYKVLDSKYYNSPQSRERIYIICTKSSPYVFKNIRNAIVPISTIIDHTVNQYFEYEEKYRLERTNSRRSIMKYKLINRISGKGGRQGERVYGIDSYGPTICASSGGPGAKTGLYEIEPLQIRTLNVLEVLRIFGFNDDYHYESLENKKMLLFYLGNSIVVNVLVELIKDLHHYL